MKKDWQTATLAELGPIFNGNSISEGYKNAHFRGVSEGTVYLGTKDVGFDHQINYETDVRIPASKANDFKLAPADTVLVCAEGGSAGRKIAITDREVFFGNKLYAISPREGISNKFVFYYCVTNQFAKSFRGAMAGLIGGVSLNKFKSLPIVLPPLPEQQRIVAILDEAFAGLATATANAERNLTSARELFDSHIEIIFAQKGRDWSKRKISEVAVLSRGHNPPKSKFSPIPKEGYVRFYQIRDGKTDDYAVYVPDTPQLHKVEPDDILMVAYRHIGRAFRGASGAFNVALCKITNKDRTVLNDDFLFRVIPTSVVRGELLKQAERSLIPSMSVEHLKIIKIPVPPMEEQKRVVTKIDRLEESVEKLEAAYKQKLDELGRLKQSILQKAFSGELTSPPLRAIKEAAE